MKGAKEEEQGGAVADWAADGDQRRVADVVMAASVVVIVVAVVALVALVVVATVKCRT